MMANDDRGYYEEAQMEKDAYNRGYADAQASAAAVAAERDRVDTGILSVKLAHDAAVEEFEMAMTRAVSHQTELAALDETLRYRRAIIEEHVSMTRADGKPLYANDLARSAAVTLLLEADEPNDGVAYRTLCHTRRIAEQSRALCMADAEAAMARVRGERAFMAAIAAMAGWRE